MSLGKAITQWGSKLHAGPIGPVQLGFNGYDLGLTTGDTEMTSDIDMMDVLYQQKGTKPSDQVITGQLGKVTATFGEISTEQLTILFPYIITSNGSVGDDSGTYERCMFQSTRDNYAKPLKMVGVDCDGLPSEDAMDTAYYYEAFPKLTSSMLNLSNATQRNITVEFMIYFHVFATGESSTKNGAFGYFGDPVQEDVPAVNWPNLTGPALVTAEATAATTVALTFDTALTLVAAVTLANNITVKVNGEFLTPVSAIITTTDIAITLGAASISAGDTVRVYISADSVEDADGYNNLAIDDRIVTNSVV